MNGFQYLIKKEYMSNKNEIIFIDWWSVKNHYSVNKFFLKAARVKNITFFTSVNTFNIYNKEPISLKALYEYRSGLTDRLKLTTTIIKILHNSKKDVCFLSYDLLFFWLVAFYARFLKIKTSAIIHNTAPTSFIKKIPYFFTPKSTLFFSFLPKNTSVLKELGCKAININHPLIKPNTIQSSKEIQNISKKIHKNFEHLIFCPSGSVNLSVIEKLAKENIQNFYIVKSQFNSPLQNIFTAKFYKDYGALMDFCDAVFIPFDSKGKVSGPFYEAIALSKTVIVKNNYFGRHVKKQFPGQVIFEGSKLRTNLNIQSFSQYNMIIANTFHKSI